LAQIAEWDGTREEIDEEVVDEDKGDDEEEPGIVTTLDEVCLSWAIVTYYDKEEDGR
jgi:hypothetical protein